MRKILALNKFVDTQKKLIDTLCASGSFGVAIFDNSQNIQSLKFQRFGRSSTVTLTTSRCFLMPMNPVFPSNTIFHNNQFHIIYHNQIITSPHGMPAFQSIPKMSANIFERDIFPKDDTSIDMSGYRVEAYANLLI